MERLEGEIGKFIQVDTHTMKRSLIGFARLLVELEIDQELVKEIEIEDEDGEILLYKVDYEWLPITCTKCKNLGHHFSNCRKEEIQAKQKKNWSALQSRVHGHMPSTWLAF